MRPLLKIGCCFLTAVWSLFGVVANVDGQEGNRLAYLDDSDPYYVSGAFPRLITPQWVGEPGVQAVVILAIDDMRESAAYEAFLRPILDRLKKIDGRAPVSIMTCAVDPADAQLQAWLKEGLSLETHTVDHPCPLLNSGDLAKAKSTYDRAVDQLAKVPNNHPVAFRTPCCDSLNTPSPRIFAEIFNQKTPAGNFLTIDSSVFNIFTSNDPTLPRALVQDSDGTERFIKYLPADRMFVNRIENYPYPYAIGRKCWQFPCVAPSDWSAQHLHQPNNPRTVTDLKAALDATVIKQGVFDLVFHPHGWLRNDQVNELIDHAVEKYGSKVRFLTFREAQERLNKHLLAGQPLRDQRGEENGVRLLDLDQDGFLDVVIGNDQLQLTRLWSPANNAWQDVSLPAKLVAHDQDARAVDAGARFGIIPDQGSTVLLVSHENETSAFAFQGNQWVPAEPLLKGLELDGQLPLASHSGRDLGMRLRDLDNDGQCELLISNPRQALLFRWDRNGQHWQCAAHGLPADCPLVDDQGFDAGTRLVDLNDDGLLDLISSNETRYAVYLNDPADDHGMRLLIAGTQGDAQSIPPIVIGKTNGGVFFHQRSLYAQNENTDRLPDLLDRRAFNDLLAEVTPTAKSPQAGLQSWHARPGFKVELVAAEPLVQDPVAFAWGADGKLWVAEMADYPLGAHESGQPGGRVRYLEDTDNDGRYDKSTVFLADLAYPTGVMPWKDGVLVTCAPEIFYAVDKDGDGRADHRESLYAGFEEGNQQHRMNGLRWGLDNWIHGANGDSGGKVRMIASGEVVDINGRDFRIRPNQNLLEAQMGQSQYGRNRDDWGNWFGCNNSAPMYHFALEDHYLRRNPQLAAPDARVQVAQAPGNAPVFPLSRTVARFNDLHTANRFTSACSTMVYRDDLFGPHFAGNAFICEPVHNLVHREVMSPNGLTFTSRRAADEEFTEFLASTDNWSRPVMIQTGPDGALWVADMYRETIEHPEWIPAEVRQNLDLRAGSDRGRIYRVFPVDKQPRPIPNLDQLDLAQLVAALDSPSGWQRDMVQQRLVERQDAAAIPLLRQLTVTSKRDTCRLHALCTLDGLNDHNPATLRAALADAHPGVRRHAVRIAEQVLNNNADVASAVAALVNDPDAAVRQQLAYSLGEWRATRAGTTLGQLLLKDADQPFALYAGLSSLNDDNFSPALETILSQPAPPAPMLMEQLLALAVGMQHDEALGQLLARLTHTRNGQFADWQFAAVGSFLDALDRRARTLEQLKTTTPAVSQQIEALQPMFEAARQQLADPATTDAPLLRAMNLLGRDREQQAEDLSALANLLSPQHAANVQAAAVAALARTDEPSVPQRLILAWPGLGHELRALVLDVLLQRNDWLLVLLDGLETRQINAGEIDAARRQRLLAHGKDDVRTRAEELFQAASNSDRAQVVAGYQSALTLAGDATRGTAHFKRVCANCHRLGDVGFAVGPELSSLTDKSKPALLVAMLDPNRAVESKYLSYTATTTAGLTHTGILSAETGNSISLLAAEGKQVQLLRGELDEFASSTKSLMPEGLEKDLTPQEMADLLAFLGSTRAPRRVFPGNEPELVRPEALRGELWLLARQCEVRGSTLVFEPRYGNLGYWMSEDDHATWSIEITEAGEYQVSLDYACDDSTAGNSLTVAVGNAQVTGKIVGTGTWDTYIERAIGPLHLPAGRHELVVRPAGAPHGAVIDLKSVRLYPLKKR